MSKSEYSGDYEESATMRELRELRKIREHLDRAEQRLDRAEQRREDVKLAVKVVAYSAVAFLTAAGLDAMMERLHDA